MTKHNQTGFGLVVLLLAAVIIGLVGFAGFKVYDNQANSKEATTTSESTELSTIESDKDIDAADKSLNDPSLDSGVDDAQLDDDMNSLL